MIRLFVGLGNPGSEYQGTRHNAGFWWLEALAARLGARLDFERNYHGLVARVNRPGGPVWLLQPMTYMNLSGKAVAPLARFFKIEPQQILAIHDELDLQPGQVKLKLGGSAAGHNGLKDIHARLGTLEFWRLRLGIGHPGVKAEVPDYVLRRPVPEDRDAIHQAIDKSLAAADALMDGDLTRAQAIVHAGVQRPKPPRPLSTAANVPPNPALADPGAPT